MKDKRNLAIRYFSWALLAAAYVFVVVFIHMNCWNQMDADFASEMYLAKILSTGNGIITTKWDYSTEIRVLGTQIITSFLFRFSNDWRLIRTISSAIHILIALGAFYYLLKVLKVEKHFPIAALMIVLPTSWIYLRFYTLFIGYYPHMMITMTAAALILDKWKSKKKETVRKVLIVLLSLGAGLGGPRMLVVFFFPLALTMLILMKSHKEELEGKQYYTWLAFGSNVIGTVINMKVLPKFFSVQDFTQLSFKFFDMNILGDNITYFIRCLGYVEGKFDWRILSYNLSFAIIFFMSIFAFYLGIKSKEIVPKIMSSYIAVAWVFYFVLQMFVMRDTVDRYMMPISVMMLPMCVCNIARCLPDIEKPNYRKFLIEALTMIVAVVSFIRVQEFLKVDYAAKWRGAADYMVENEIRTGYCTFWNANNIVEYSNGYVDMYHWGSSEDINLSDPSSLRHWLQPKSHFDGFPEGKLAVVLVKDEYDNCSLKDVLDVMEPAYENDDLILYTFNSVDELLEYVKAYSTCC